MKPYPRYDFPVSVRHHMYEIQNSTAGGFFKNIYDVILNFSMTILFVPNVDISTVNLRLYQSDILDEDNVKNETQAKLICIANAFYSVTPNSLMAGQEKLIPQYFPEIPGGVIFFVTSQEFQVFSQELSNFYEELLGEGFYAYRTISDIKNFAFADFLIERVITSKYLLPHHLEILGR
ncbi:hypothetical protein Cylst_6721 (plasmid) [Cylindrospermum stagnale PCC 7417]|uniref:Uncharacterized protein n=1 Tax=Cylindrospermum stagnale PCC 7417 TaxID=56107 RepID=K9X8N1_9NOST|nr:hypothetical protein [Cylindrospermum stagnale]AFZ28464.1 hypothetical protein Cylst_6721 [Cylindrospermum stagnale PCC 7417]